MSTVLVTGGSGFVGAHCIVALLKAGHTARTTIRNLVREEEVRDMIREGGEEPGERVEFFAADLESDDGWDDAVTDCEYVLHVASPFPSGPPMHEDDLIVPAREGALRVLGAARDAGVKRVVLTSSFAAIGYGHPQLNRPFDENDWTDPGSPQTTPYAKSKTLAERAAWDFVKREGGAMELAVVNPVGIFGPALAADTSTSILIVQRLMNGEVPGMPNLDFGLVDVRDVADLHLLAMTSPAAKGERFLAVAGDFMGMAEIAKILKARMGAAARHVPTRSLPDWLVRIVGMFDPSVKLISSELGIKKNATNAKAKRLLGWSPRSNDEAIVATAQSLIKLGMVKA
ncbi:MAG TPA: aldehyde reductase [Rhizomicrobium sp.]|nr:aldehyde reductase [Rhizomicrobium sp.]